MKVFVVMARVYTSGGWGQSINYDDKIGVYKTREAAEAKIAELKKYNENAQGYSYGNMRIEEEEVQ